MRKTIPFLFGLTLLIGSAQAQFLEFGGGIGLLNYSGDLIRGYQISNVKPAVSIHHRQNYSEYISIKWGLTAGYLAGSDNKPHDAFAAERNASFNIRIVELSPVIEYHFLNYKDKYSTVDWSPYVFFGASFTRIYGVEEPREEFNKIQAAIPVGIGYKHMIGRKLVVGAEFGARKMFFDYLDNISDGDLAVKDYQYGNPHDNDWYYYFGINVSYVLHVIPCPFPYIPNRYMLKR